MEHIKVQNGDEEVVIPIPKSYSDCVTLIRSDFYRYSGRVESLFRMWLKSIRSPSLALNFWLRLSSYKVFLYYYARIRLAFVAKKYGLQVRF